MNPRILRPHSAVISALSSWLLALAAVVLIPGTGSAATNWDGLNGNQFSNQVGSHVHSLA